MKTFFLTAIIAVFLLLYSNGLQAQTTQTHLNKVVMKDIIHSKILNEQREVWVYVPSSASDTICSKQRYPVIYLLDGDSSHFSYVATISERFGSSYVCPEMIVVGIPNTDRTRDLTPTHMDSWQFLDLVEDSSFLKTSGAGENFISFIEKELMPHIDSLYPTAPYNMLIGHSFGGLTVMNTLIHHTNLFKAYVAIDPAMAWGNQKLLKEAKKALGNNNYAGVSLFLGIANTMTEGMDTIRVKKDTNKCNEYIRSIFELRDHLNSNKQNQLNFAWRYYNNDDHFSIPLIVEYDALRFIFNSYQFKMLNHDCKKIEDTYEKVSEQFGYKVKPPESMVNGLAYLNLFFKRYDESLYLFKLNVSNYPKSWNVYDAMGDYYDAKGDKASAIDNYKRVLSIKEIPDTRKKLEKLQGK